MIYFKDILAHINTTGNLNIKILDMIDLDIETTMALDETGITTIGQLSEMEIDKITAIPHININRITEFFNKLSDYTYYSDGNYILNTKGKLYLEKISA